MPKHLLAALVFASLALSIAALIVPAPPYALGGPALVMAVPLAIYTLRQWRAARRKAAR